MTTTSAPVGSVIQSDREASWPFWSAVFDYPATHDHHAKWMAGDFDETRAIQAFAAYRVQIEQSSRVGEGGALRTAVCNVLNMAWCLLDSTANENPPEVPQEDWNALSESMDKLEALIPASEGPCWPGVAARLLANPPLAPGGDVREALENIANGREPSTGSPLAVTQLEDVRRYARQALAALQSSTSAYVPEGWRPEVIAFANLMEQQLRANDHKPGWKEDERWPLFHRMVQEMRETGDVLDEGSPDTIGREAADVANFAMMIADVCGALSAVPPLQAGEE